MSKEVVRLSVHHVWNHLKRLMVEVMNYDAHIFIKVGALTVKLRIKEVILVVKVVVKLSYSSCRQPLVKGPTAQQVNHHLLYIIALMGEEHLKFDKTTAKMWPKL